MDKEKKNRSGSLSGAAGRNTRGDERRTSQPGAPQKSNRQTGGTDRYERDDSSRGADRNTTKKGANNI